MKSRTKRNKLSVTSTSSGARCTVCSLAPTPVVYIKQNLHSVRSGFAKNEQSKCPNKISPRGRGDDMPCRWQFDGGISFCRQSGHLRQSMGPKIAADLRLFADGFAARTSLVAGGG